jgi:hypothetical protein
MGDRWPGWMREVCCHGRILLQCLVRRNLGGVCGASLLIVVGVRSRRRRRCRRGSCHGRRDGRRWR